MNNFESKKLPETYWQKSSEIVGPATVEDFVKIGQIDTRNAIEDFIVRNSNFDTKLLDAGCNTGVEGYRLMSKTYRGHYFGIDSNLKALSFAMQNLVGTRSAFTLSDLTNIPFPDSSFEIVLNKDVIEHAPGYEDILRELARLTSKYLVLSMFIKLNNKQDIIKREPEGYYHNSYETSRFFAFMKLLGLGSPKILFENETDQVFLFTK